MFENEEVYHNSTDVTYYFEEGVQKCNQLLVVFSGYAENTSKIKYKYNYVYALQNIKCHKLFILDKYGQTGSYYLGEKLNFDVESSVISLILHKAVELNVNIENIITLGSSKGGSAALYYGLKYNLGNILAGAFQTKISDLISMRRPETEEFLLGKKDSDNYNILYEKLNQIILEQLRKPIHSNLFLMTSENDWQYKPHVEPFINELKRNKISHEIIISDDMRNHNEISIYFPKYFRRKLMELLYNIHLEINNIVLEDCIFIDYTVKNMSQNNYRLELMYEMGNLKNIIPNRTKLDLLFSGKYIVSAYIYDRNDNLVYKNDLASGDVSKGKYIIEDVHFEIVDNVLSFSVNTNNNEDLEFAFYLYENNSIIERIMYQNENFIERIVDVNKSYKIQYYLRTTDGQKLFFNTESIAN